MGYARIKDGIYEITATPESNRLYENSHMVQIYDSKIFGRRDVSIDSIISSSDNLIKLIDAVIWKVDGVDYPYVESVYDIFGVKIHYNHKKYYNKLVSYQGAIWIEEEPGIFYLKPVTKMNEEGEMELL